MHLSTFVEMLESGLGDRVLAGVDDRELTGAELTDRVRRASTTLDGHGAVVYAGENHPLLPVPALAAAWYGIPFVPVNYRLEDDQLVELIAGQSDAQSGHLSIREMERIRDDNLVDILMALEANRWGAGQTLALQRQGLPEAANDDA